MKQLICLLFPVLVCAVLHAQSYYFRHYQVEQGLSNNTVFCSAQDKRGFFWMGTKDGLNRFDGSSFKIFRNDPDDSTSIGDNFVRSLFIDKEDNLYAGTRIGVYLYDARTEQFALIYRSSEEIRDIKKDKNRNLWIISGKTLVRLDQHKKLAATYSPTDFFSATSLCTDQQQNIWVATATGLLEKYEPSANTFTAYDVFAGETNTAPKWIEKIYATNAQSILIGTSNYGVKLFDLTTRTHENLLSRNPDKTDIFARDFVQSSPTEYWMATESGIFIYNTITRVALNLKKNYNNPYAVSDNAVYTLCRDREGGIWAGTYFGGVNYYPRQYAPFERFFPGYNNYSLSGNAVREISEDKYGNLWIGTEDAGLNKMDKRTGVITQYRPSGSSTDISYSNIHGLLTKNEELWIGTFEHGLDILNIKTGKVVRHFGGSNSSPQLKSNFIVVIYQAINGTVFIGTRQGLYKFNEQRKDFDPVPQIPSHCFVHTITGDENGKIWVGTLGNGLYSYDDYSKQVTHFTHIPRDRKSLAGNSVNTIFKDTKNNLWAGTEGGGLCLYDPKDQSFTSFSTKEGFPSNTIFKILEDGKNMLWITTSKGLVRFDPVTKKINVFTTANGLLSNQFNYNSGYKDSTGKIYFGSAKGLISFNPDSFVKNSFVPPVLLTGLYINNDEITISSDKSPLTQSISYTSSLELPYNRSSFSIGFAALSFTAPEMLEYQYIMEGLDKDWTYLKTNRKVYFTNLSPGTYTFRVKAANSNGIWSEDAASVTIKILPPFWSSRLAYFLYALLGGLLLWLLFNSYHRRLAEKTKIKIEHLEHEKENEIHKAKIDFFTNVAHEIKTPLTLIKAPLEKIIKKAGNHPEFGNNLTIMERNTERLIELTNQLLDFRKVESNGYTLTMVKTNINELLLERYNSFRPLAEQKNITLDLILPRETVMAMVDIDSIQKIINNLIYNAVSYGQSRVVIELLFIAGQTDFTIEFRNDGNIIPAEMKEKIFEPFYRLKENRNKSGSGIGLALSRSLAELHNGSIYLKQSSHESNIFVLKLPLSNTTIYSQEN